MIPAVTPKAKTHFFKNLNLNTVLDANPKNGNYSGTKLIGTMGPSCHEVDTLSAMLEAGMAAGRLDLTWGPLEFHRKSMANMHAAMRQTRRLCATMIDTLGRELMIRGQWTVNEQGYPWVLGRKEVEPGQTIIITTRSDAPPADNVLPIMYDQFTEMAQVGDTVYIGRYLVCGADSASLYLEVKEVNDTDVICEAKNAAVLEGLLCVFHAERSASTLSNKQNTLPLLSDWDKECIKALGVEYEIDYINLSFTRNGDDVREARQWLDSIGMNNTRILAKLETRQSLLNFEEILDEADGVVISRGNLGLDVAPEKMALVQKSLTQACNLVGKPVIITRVVDTMTDNPRPTRAEATDVANAVLDGVDGILLGAETLRGSYPVECIETITRICRAAEEVFDHNHHYDQLMMMAFEATQQTNQPATAHDRDHELPLALCPNIADSPRKPKSDSVVNSAKTMVNFSQIKMMNGGDMSNFAAASLYANQPYLSKLESLASSAVRAADKVAASLIVVYTHTGRTAELVAKYRPPMPILTLVVPHLVSDSLKWRLEGKSTARQCMLVRGLMPTLVAPSPSGEQLMTDAINMSFRMGLVKAMDHVVCVQRVNDDFCVKIINVGDYRSGIKRNDSGPLA